MRALDASPPAGTSRPLLPGGLGPAECRIPDPMEAGPRPPSACFKGVVQMKEVVLGFAGCGRMGQIAHIANYTSIQKVRLKGLFDLKREQARLVARRYGIERVYDSLEELVADPEIEAIVCTLPWEQNVHVAVRCLEAGKHVVTEKPLAGWRRDGETIVQAAKRAGRHACVGYMKCFDAGVEKAREAVRAWAEPPAFVRVHFGGGDWVAGNDELIHTGERPHGMAPGHQAPPDLSPEQQQAFLFYVNQHVHHLGLVRYLLGTELELKEVLRHGPSHVVVFTAGPTLVTMEYSPLAAEWWEESTRLQWKDGYVDIVTPPPLLRNVPANVRVYRHRGAGGSEFWEPSVPASWAFRRAAEHFVRVVRGEEQPRVPAEHALRDVIHCEEMARMGRWL